MGELKEATQKADSENRIGVPMSAVFEQLNTDLPAAAAEGEGVNQSSPP